MSAPFLVTPSLDDALRQLRGRHLLFAMTTPALYTFTENWLCSLGAALRPLSGVSVLVIAAGSDESVCKRMKPYAPRQRAIMIACVWYTGVLNTTDKSGWALDTARLFQSQKEGSPGNASVLTFASSVYKRATKEKLNVLQCVAQSDMLRRSPFKWIVLTDVDLVVRKDPFAWLEAHASPPDQSNPRDPSSSLATAEVYVPRNRCHHASSAGGTINTGVLIFRAGNFSRNLFASWSAVLLKQRTGSIKQMVDGTDQGAFNWLVSGANGGRLLPGVSLLPCAEFAGGWQLLFACGPHQLSACVGAERMHEMRPLANRTTFHFNFMHDSHIKQTCAEQTGLWVRRDGGVCMPFEDLPWDPARLISKNPHHRAGMVCGNQSKPVQ